MSVARWVGVLWVLLVLLTRHDARADGHEKHYVLHRQVVRVTLTGTPVARVLCTVRANESGASDTVVWDPEERRSNVRYALLPFRDSTSEGPLSEGFLSDLTARLARAAVEGVVKAKPTLTAAEGEALESALRSGIKETLPALARDAKLEDFPAYASGKLVISKLSIESRPELKKHTADLAPVLKSPELQNLLEEAFRQATRLHYQPFSTSCWSEPRVLKGEENRPDDLIGYHVEETTAVAPAVQQFKLTPAKVEGKGSELGVEVAVTPVSGEERTRVLQQKNDGINVSRLRSLDPTTPLISDALAALATVALERANNAGKEQARRLLRTTLCDGLTVGRIKSGLKQSVLKRALEKLGWADERRILNNTCALIDTLRVDELVSAQDAVWRAVGVDASELAGQFLQTHLADQEEDALGEHLSAVTSLVSSALTSGAATTERDAQALLLNLGRIGLYYKNGEPVKTDWQYGLELGMAVLNECLRAGECSADELGRLLAEEIQLDGDPDILENWPELPALLGRAASVLRPPPGTAATSTVANAVSVVLDVVDHALLQKSSAERDGVICVAPKTVDAMLVAVPKAPREKGKEVGKEEAKKAYEKELGARKCPATLKPIFVEDVAALHYSKIKGTVMKLDATSAAWLCRYANLCAGGDFCVFDCADVEYPVQDLTKKELADGIRDGIWRRGRERALGFVRTLRSVVAALQGSDVSSAVIQLERVFETAIEDECRSAGTKCKVAITTVQLRKGFRILSALATYGASYREAETGKDAGELEKARAEERKKAVESLIDAVTDRSERHGDWVISLGSNVAFNGDYRFVPSKKGRMNYVNKAPVSLRTGFALQALPREGSTAFGKPGFHAMLSVLDLAQYASLGGEDSSKADTEKLPDPEFTSALRLGAEIGLLLGEPSFPMAAAAQFAWIPRVDYGATARHEWSLGASFGVFVPFIDFN